MTSMYALLEILDASGYALYRFILTLLWQGSIVFLTAAVLDVMLRNRDAAVRHMVWISALAVVPLVPLITSIGGHVGVPVKPIVVAASYTQPVRTIQSPISAPVVSVTGIDRGVTTVESSLPANASSAKQESSNTSPVPALKPSLSDLRRYPWVTVMAVYGIVVVFLLGRILIGYLALRNRIANGRDVTTEPVMDVFRHAVTRTGLTQAVRIVEHRDMLAPVAVGIIRSRILLPGGITAHLSGEELSAVALHEAAHLKRRDPQALLFVTLVRALLFFHPVVWFVSRRIAVLAEYACDSMVLDADIKPISYASVLTRLAEELTGRAQRPEMAVGLLPARSMFFRRIQAILSDERSRIRKLSASALVMVAIAGISMVMLAAGLPLGERVAVGDEASDSAAISRTDHVKTVTGRVTHDGDPVAGAELHVIVPDMYTPYSSISRLVGTTGADGEFSVTFEASKLNQLLYQLYPTVIAVHTDYAIGWASTQSGGENLQIDMGDPATITGTLVDPSGQPIGGVTIETMAITGRPSNMVSALATSMLGNLMPLATTSSADGSFRIGRLPAGTRMAYRVTSDKWVAVPGLTFTMVEARSSDVTITLEPVGTITGRVVNQNGQPITNVPLVAHGMAHSTNNPFVARTDNDGYYWFKGLPADMYVIIAVMDEKNESLSYANTYIRDVELTASGTIEAPDIVVTPGRLVTGRVLDSADGSPVAGVGIQAQHPDYNSHIYFGGAITDDYGSYTIRIAEEGAEIRLQGVPEGIVQPSNSGSTVIVNPGSVPAVADFTVTRGLAVHGRVVDMNGNPVPGAVVEGDMYGDSGSWRGRLVADDSGGFTIYGIEDNTQLVVLITSSERKLRLETTLDIHNDGLQTVVLVPYETATLRGRVIDESGNPVASASMQVMIDYGEYSTGQNLGRTDTDGRYVIENLVIGMDYRLIAMKDGYADTGIPLPDLTTDMGPLPDAVMKSAERWLEITVQYEDGTPVSEIAAHIDGSSSGFKQAVSGADGTMRFEGLAGVLEPRLYLRHHQYGNYQFNFLETNTHHTLTIYRNGRTLIGRIVDADGYPVAGARVTLRPQQHESGQIIASIQADADGRFQFDNILRETVTMEFRDGDRMAQYDDVAVTGDEQTFVLDEVHDPRAVTPVVSESTQSATHDMPVVTPDDNEPSLRVGQWISGGPVDLAAEKGNIVVLDFWDSRHEDNIEWLQVMNMLYNAYRDRGVLFVGIHEYTDDPDAVEDIVREQGLDYPVAVDAEPASEGGLGATFETFGAQYFFYDIVIGRDGSIVRDVFVNSLERTIQEKLGNE